MTVERKHREEIVRFGRRLYERGFVAATDGNLSVRLDEGRLLITPTCMCKGMMEADDLVVVDLGGHLLEGRRNVSSEVAMHLLIYRMRPEVCSIVHAHPPTATGFAAAGIALEQPLISEVVLTLGSVPLAKYACPGSADLSDSLRPLVAHHNAILMANHGVVTYGDSIEQAFMHMETVEHFAKIALVARAIGTPQPIAPDEVRRLEAIRTQLESARRAERDNLRTMEVKTSA